MSAWPWVAGVLLLGLAAFVTWRWLPSQTVVSPLGTEILYDDFAFSVLGSDEVATLGEGPTATTAAGRFVVVRLAVLNHAQRVDFTFRPEVVRLVDTAGTEYSPSPAGQAALLAQGRRGCVAPLSAGTRCETELAFDVPPDADELLLRMSFGNGLPEVLDRLAYGERRLMLH